MTVTSSVQNQHTFLLKEKPCPYCGQPMVMVRDKTVLGTVMVKGECAAGHSWYPDMDQFIDLLVDKEYVFEEPNECLMDVLRERDLPVCFGAMRTRPNFRITPCELRYEGKGDTVEELVQSVMDKKIGDAETLALGLVKCATCDCFDRCKVLSGLPTCHE